jgi:hypothetical protein
VDGLFAEQIRGGGFEGRDFETYWTPFGTVTPRRVSTRLLADALFCTGIDLASHVPAESTQKDGERSGCHDVVRPLAGRRLLRSDHCFCRSCPAEPTVREEGEGRTSSSRTRNRIAGRDAGLLEKDPRRVL